MYIQKSEILNRINPGDKVLDVGSWNDVFPRANVIIDLNPYDTRKNFFPDQDECFTKDTWYIADVNKAETWARFADKEFDFVICSHLLEDVRDPLFVCEQLIRVSKRGYIEVPTRYRECARAKAEDTVSGYDHHRWLVDVLDDSLVFTAKLHWAHTVDYLTEAKRNYLNFHNFHYFGVLWEDSFNFSERCPKGELLEGANLIYQFEKLELSNLHEFTSLSRDNDNRPRGNMLWVDQFKLPIEAESKEVMQIYMDSYRQLNVSNLFSESQTRIGKQGIEIDELKQNIAKDTQTIRNQGMEIDELKQNITKCQMDITYLTEVNRAMLESSSWRLTTPLRATKKFISEWL